MAPYSFLGDFISHNPYLNTCTAAELVTTIPTVPRLTQNSSLYFCIQSYADSCTSSSA